MGVITGVRGLKGEVRIKSFTGEPKDIATYGELLSETGTKTFKVKVTGLAKGQLLARIGDVNDRDAAEALKGTQLFVSRDKLPAAEEDEWSRRSKTTAPGPF